MKLRKPPKAEETVKPAKKPIFKKWWFWLLVFFIAIGIIGGEPTQDSADGSESSATSQTSSAIAEQVKQPVEGPREEPDKEPPIAAKPESTQNSPSTAPPQVEPTTTIPDNSTFEIHYLDVGQADAALVLCDGKSMLIDGGNSEDSNLIYSYLKSNSISHLDYIVATHAHEDHVGGLSGALNYASVDKAYCSVKSYDSKAFESFVKYLNKQNVSITVPAAGDSFTLGSAAVKILGPVSHSDDPNNTSIVLRVVYGNTSFLFAGDAERDEEQEVLNAGYDLGSTVLKVGHHGSETSTTYPFLREIMPDYAVISVGKGNSYGHPTENTLSRLRDAGVKTYRTDLQGTIICESDGDSVSFSVQKNKDADTLAATAPVAPPKQESSSKPSSSSQVPSTPEPPVGNESTGRKYVLNTNSKKFHYPTCGSVDTMKESNKGYFTGTRDDVLAMGYKPCGNCHP